MALTLGGDTRSGMENWDVGVNVFSVMEAEEKEGSERKSEEENVF